MDSISKPVPLCNIRVYAQNDWSKMVAKAPEGTLSGQLISSGVRAQITASQIIPTTELIVSNLYYVGADQVPGSNAAVSIVPYLLQFGGYSNESTAVFTQ